MIYTKTNWQTGDVITATKLNNMENGIADASGGGGAFKVTITSSTDPNTQEWVYTADKTFAEISEAIESAQYIYAVQSWNEEECNFIPLRGFVAEQYILFSICDVYGDEDGMRLRYQSITINPDESVYVEYSSKLWNSI